MALSSKALRIRLLSIACVVALGPIGATTTGCSLIVDFDRSKIHDGAADGAPEDATTTDAETDAEVDGGRPDAADATDSRDASDASDAQDAKDASDAADASDSSDAADANDASDASDASDAAPPECVTSAGCDDRTPCTDDVCTAAGRCTHLPTTGAVACNDGNACTTGDTCQLGACVGTPLVCTASGACRVAGTCNPTTGTCSAETNAPNGPTCSDGDGCTQTDTCQAGTCLGANPKTCPAATNACKVAGSCLSPSGACSPETNRPDGDPCSDANACTTGDACQAGTCAPGAQKICVAPVCKLAGVCDTTTGLCPTPINAPTTITCDDGTACTVGDSCDGAGACSSGVPTDALCTNTSQPVCTATGCVPRQASSLVVTELNALGGGAGNEEFVELHLPSTALRGNIAGFTITNAAGASFTLHPASDPSGAGNQSLYLEPGDYVFGVANPATGASVPAGAKFVIGEPGSAYAIDEAGDEIVVRNLVGNVLDTVDFRAAPSGPGFVYDTSGSATITGNAFPGAAGKSTQLDADAISIAGNDSGAAWCVTFRGANTRGAANASCGVVVVNEVLFDAAGAGANEANVFVELAGAGGAPIGGLRIFGADATGAAVGVDVTIPAGTRMPLDGFFVLADGDVDGGLTAVRNADLVVANGQPPAGPGGVQLFRSIPRIDAVGYGGAANVNAEGTPFAHTPVAGVSVSITRNATSLDTNDNAADFRDDATPSPGE